MVYYIYKDANGHWRWFLLAGIASISLFSLQSAN